MKELIDTAVVMFDKKECTDEVCWVRRGTISRVCRYLFRFVTRTGSIGGKKHGEEQGVEKESN